MLTALELLVYKVEQQQSDTEEEKKELEIQIGKCFYGCEGNVTPFNVVWFHPTAHLKVPI